MPDQTNAGRDAGRAADRGGTTQQRVADARRKLRAFRLRRATQTATEIGGELNGSEARPLSMLEHRQAGLLAHVDTNGLGLEIGPSHNPITPKASGYDVHILDVASQSGLRKKYADHGVDLETIDEVDYIWKGQPYAELVGDTRFNWIIASHVIEHVPDLVGFVNDCFEILAPGGVLALVVPDLRYCFDALRPASSLSGIVDAHLARRTKPTAGQVADFYFNLASLNGKTSWHPGERGGWGRASTIADAQRFTEQALKGRTHDVHVWRFTPSSFRLQVAQLGQLGLLGSDEAFFQDSPIGEFYVGLTQAAESSNPSSADDMLALAVKARSEFASAVLEQP